MLLTLFRTRAFLVLICAGFIACKPAAAADATTTSPAGGSLHDQMIAQYMAGKWDDLHTNLTANIKEIAAMPAAQKADVDYIRQAINECHPAWWKLCKAGQKVRFRPVIFKTPIGAMFDPANKSDIQINYVGTAGAITVKWDAAAMDNPAVEGELPFSKGEKNEVAVWTNLGTGVSWAEIPPRSQVNVTQAVRQALDNYLNFRGNIAGAYHVSPRARRYAIFLGLAGWSHEFEKSAIVMSQKTVGALFVAEVIGHPEIYRSIPRLQISPEERTEAKIVLPLQNWIRNHDLTFAEDKAFRDALRACAAGNDIKVRTSMKVMLPNGQAISLDKEADKALAAQRDAWIKGQFGK